MATEEKKPETKKTEEKQSPQVKQDLPPPQPPLPLPYKTCSLKVSIHCEGCKRKVKKILSSIEGVYRVEIDVKLHKVTVMGIASPEILLQKLLKAGKNALLLPEIPDPVENKPVAPKEKKNKKKTKKKNKEEDEEKVEKIDEATSSSSGNDKPVSEKTDAVKESNSGDGGETSAPVKEEKKEKTPVQADSPSPAAEKKAEEVVDDVAGTGSGNVGKKKKKKGQNQKLSSANNPTGAPARPGSPPPPPTTTTTPAAAADHDRPFNQNDGHHHHIMTNNHPPGQHMYHPYPPSYYAPQVMYGVSYNVAQSPVSVDGASYYTPPPPHAYAYMHPGYLPPHDQNPYPSRPSDSFELFSDENPNGCTVM